MASPTDTIAALATPVGTSALAVLRVSGPEAAALTQAIFGEVPPARLARHADYRSVGGTVLDDVVFTFFAAPNSYSGEDTLEISSHGNPFIAQKILEDLLQRGCRAAEAGEFTKRAFLSGRLDLSQAEAVMDLIHARSERALAAANQQLRGSLGRRMDELIQQLLAVLASLEAYIDFPDEDLPPENREHVRQQIERLQSGAGNLLATSHYGEILRSGVRTVIVGEPNAGKSSLLNRLVGRDRALVSPEPGTTRDYLEELISVGPHALRLVDTAGLNSSPGSLERRGIEKTLEQAAEADLFLWVVDAAAPLPDLPSALVGQMTAENTLIVLNKCDLPSASAGVDAVASARPGFAAIRVSALQGDGFEALSARLGEMADRFRTEVGDEVIAINARHAAALERARLALHEAGRKLSADESIELIASDLREALAAFGEIAGKVDNERMLDVLFSTFCIGK